MRLLDNSKFSVLLGKWASRKEIIGKILGNSPITGSKINKKYFCVVYLESIKDWVFAKRKGVFSQIIILSSVAIPDVNQELILKMLPRQNQCQKVCLQTRARYIRFFQHNIMSCFKRCVNVDKPSRILIQWNLKDLVQIVIYWRLKTRLENEMFNQLMIDISFFLA